MSKKELKQKQCLGTLFHSQTRMASGRDPLCAGIRTNLRESQAALPRENVGPGDFKYICIGHSIFDKEGAKLDRELTGNAGNALDQTVELPYCSGIEIISSTQMISGPAVLNPANAGAPVASGDTGSIRPANQQRPGRSFVPGQIPNASDDWNVFQERFVRSAKKMLARMGTNLEFMGRTAKQAVNRIKDWSGED